MAICAPCRDMVEDIVEDIVLVKQQPSAFDFGLSEPGSCWRSPEEAVDYEEVYNMYAEDYANSPFETGHEKDPKLQAGAIRKRWQQLGILQDPNIERWASNVEFISLGCYCGPAKALQMLGLRKRAYPLDFMRSDVFGVLKLLKAKFKNFLDWKGEPKPGVVPNEMTYSTTWGGSFWHHDISDPKVRADFQRRVDRLMGEDPKVPLGKPRFFVHAVNGSAGVAHVHELHAELLKLLPGTPVYLLTLIDNQPEEELDELHHTYHPHVLFFKSPSSIWRSSSFTGLDSLAEMYTHGIARAMSIWTRHEDRKERILEDLRALGNSVAPFYANSPATHLFNVVEGVENLDSYLAEHDKDVEEAYESEEDHLEGRNRCVVS